MHKLFPSALVALLIAAPAFAAPGPAANVTLSGGWFRALPAGLPAGGYFTLHNGGTAPLKLTAASSPACGMLMLHKSVTANGVARMLHVSSVDVPAGGAVTFAPGGYHLMCMKPKPAMKPGGTVSVTLEFADGSKTTASFAVRNAAGR
jgi:periplasmic copper chaperone A